MCGQSERIEIVGQGWFDGKKKMYFIDMNVRMCIVVGANGKQNRRHIFRSLNK